MLEFGWNADKNVEIKQTIRSNSNDRYLEEEKNL